MQRPPLLYRELSAEIEAGNQILEKIGLAGQLLTGGSGLLSGSGVVLDYTGDLVNTGSDLCDGLGLFMGGGGDIGHHPGDFLCAFGYQLKLLGGGGGRFAPLLTAVMEVSIRDAVF